MAFLIVLVDLAISFVPGLFVRAVAKRLVFGKPAHANPDGCLLRLDLERALGGFGNFAHTDSNPDRASLQILSVRAVALQPKFRISESGFNAVSGPFDE
jgi:hypothetical protein